MVPDAMPACSHSFRGRSLAVLWFLGIAHLSCVSFAMAKTDGLADIPCRFYVGLGPSASDYNEGVEPDYPLETLVRAARCRVDAPVARSDHTLRESTRCKRATADMRDGPQLQQCARGG